MNINEGDFDLGEIKLSPKSTLLGEVVVSADKVIEKADKYVLFLFSIIRKSREFAFINL